MRGSGRLLLPPTRGPPVYRMSRPQDIKERDVYIGRGTQGGIPKSFWQNMYVIDRTPGGLSREQVIARPSAAERGCTPVSRPLSSAQLRASTSPAEADDATCGGARMRTICRSSERLMGM